jgi:hypothetical protein
MMTVSYTGVSQRVEATKVIYAHSETIKALAQAAMISLAEADIDMLLDCPGEYPTKADMERVFQGLHEQATDFVNDTFDDLKERILAELSQKRYTARIKALHYDTEGQVEDISLQVDFE